MFSRKTTFGNTTLMSSLEEESTCVGEEEN
jgi:hypothetical protein